MPDPKQWGIYVYFAADVQSIPMQKAAWRTLKTLASVGSSAQVGITALIDLPAKDTEYYLIPEAPDNPCVRKWPVLPDRFLPNVNSASADAIYDFLRWSDYNCPAKNVALVFWGHGYALDDFDPRLPANSSFVVTDSTVDGAGADLGRSAKSFPGKRGQELKLLYDSTHHSVLNNRDFANVLRSYSTRSRHGKKVQILGLDCCNMAMAEVLCELQDSAEYVVAAETGLPFRSWLTAPALRQLIARSPANPETFCTLAVNDFIGSFSSSSPSYVGLSVCKMAAFTQLEDAMRELASALSAVVNEPEIRAAIGKAWFRDVSFVVDGMIDLSSFCTFLQTYVPQMPPYSMAIEAAGNVRDAVAKVVVHTGFSPTTMGRRIGLSNGLSFWFPPWIQYPSVDYVQIDQSKDYLTQGYSQTRFAQATGWDRFLRKLLFFTQGQ